MLGLRKLAESKPGASSLAPAILLDVITDGGLIGLSVGLRSPTAAVLAVALAPEIFFLGVTLAEELKGGKGRLIGLGVLIGAGIAAMGAVGWWLSTGPSELYNAFFGFGAIALTYLVFEELQSEAHEQRTATLMAGALFAAFVPVFVAGMILK